MDYYNYHVIIYNISIKIGSTKEEEWVHWQKAEHIPDLIATGRFYDYRFYRLLEGHETDGHTYIVQYFATSIDQYNAYFKEFSQALRQKAVDKWGNQFISF